MRIVVLVLGVISVVVGLIYFLLAFTLPFGYNLSTASAVQATQVYSQASYDALMAIAAFVFAGLCASSYPRALRVNPTVINR